MSACNVASVGAGTLPRKPPIGSTSLPLYRMSFSASPDVSVPNRASPGGVWRSSRWTALARVGAAAASNWLLCAVLDDSNGVSNGPSPPMTPLTDAAAGSRSTAAPANASAVRCPALPDAGSAQIRKAAVRL